LKWSTEKCQNVLQFQRRDLRFFWVENFHLSPGEYAKAFYITAVDDGEEC
jgi:hypothetical protein